MDKKSDVIGKLENGEDSEIKLKFIGNHFETYYISLTISFVSEGKDYQKSFSYKTQEDSMNLIYFDNIRG